MKTSLGALIAICASLGGALMSTSAVAEVYVTVANRQSDRPIIVLSRRVDRDRDWRELGVVRGGQVADFVLPRQGVYEFRATNRRGNQLYATNPIQLRDGQSMRIRGNGSVVVSNDRGPDRRMEQRGVLITR